MEITDAENELNKTMKIKRNENIFISVRGENPNKPKNKVTKHYLTPTACSINRTTQKFISRPLSSSSNLSNASSILSRRDRINRSLSKSANCGTYYDDLNHFGDCDNLNYDTYGHFS